MVEQIEQYSSIEGLLCSEGFLLAHIINNDNFEEEIHEFLSNLKKGFVKDFRIIPAYLARQDYEPRPDENIHYIYIKKE